MNEKKPLHVAPSPETIKLKTWYAFTYNPSGNAAFGQRFKDIRHYLSELRIEGLHYVLYPELSSAGRLHLHGYVKFKKWLAVGRFYVWLSYQSAAYEMDTIDDFEKWHTYCTKCKMIMEPLCDQFKVPYELDKKSVPLCGKKGSLDKFLQDDESSSEDSSSEDQA